MLLAIELCFVVIISAGIWMLTVGTHRFNIGPRLMMVTFALTALSWMAFLITTIAMLVFANQIAS